MATITINPTSAILKVGDSLKVQVFTDASDYSVFYSVNNVCSYDKATYTLTATGAGQCQVTFKINIGSDDEQEAILSLDARETLESTTLNIAPDNVTFKVDETQVLTIDTDADDYQYNIDDTSIVSYNKEIKTLTALKQGNTNIIFSAQATNKELAQVTIPIVVNAKDEVDDSKTIFEVSPTTINLKVGQSYTLSVISNVNFINFDIDDTKVCSFNVMTKTIRAIGAGNALLVLKAQKENADLITYTIHINVQAQTDDDGTFDNNLENVYFYDETMPTSKNGTIGYKCGYTPDSPLIKLQFSESQNRWDVIGIKIVKYNVNNEPYDLYFMASEGQINNDLNKMDLNQIILDMVDSIINGDDFQKTISQKIQDFIDSYLPTIQDKIDEYVENYLENANLGSGGGNLPDDFFNYDFGGFSAIPYDKTQIKWVGVVILNAPSRNGSDITSILSKRLNTNGIEGDWIPMAVERINEKGFDDPISRIFDNLDPYKSMDRLEIPPFFSNWSKEVYSQSFYDFLQKIQKTKGQLLTMQDSDFTGSYWLVPIKKCYYIDIEVILQEDYADEMKSYYIRAIGSEPFDIDLKDAIEGITEGQFKLNYLRCDDIGYKEFVVNGTKVSAILHPAFLDYAPLERGNPQKTKVDGVNIIKRAETGDQALYVDNANVSQLAVGYCISINADSNEYYIQSIDKVNNVITLYSPLKTAVAENSYINIVYYPAQIADTPIDSPQEKDFIYVGAYLASQIDNKGIPYSVPFALPCVDNGNLANIFRYAPYYYIHLLDVMQSVEKGYIGYKAIKQGEISFKKFGGMILSNWNGMNNTDENLMPYRTGFTYPLFNKTGVVYSKDGSFTPINSYRGIENLNGFMDYALYGVSFTATDEVDIASCQMPKPSFSLAANMVSVRTIGNQIGTPLKLLANSLCFFLENKNKFSYYKGLNIKNYSITALGYGSLQDNAMGNISGTWDYFGYQRLCI